MSHSDPLGRTKPLPPSRRLRREETRENWKIIVAFALFALQKIDADISAAAPTAERRPMSAGTSPESNFGVITRKAPRKPRTRAMTCSFVIPVFQKQRGENNGEKRRGPLQHGGVRDVHIFVA
jgi:hypothetical protein